MLIDDCIELCSNFRKIPVQIERFHADLITAHLIAVIRLNCFVCCGIQKHSRYPMRFRTEFRLFVLHIGEYLIQITGIQRMHIIYPRPQEAARGDARLERHHLDGED